MADEVVTRPSTVCVLLRTAGANRTDAAWRRDRTFQDSEQHDPHLSLTNGHDVYNVDSLSPACCQGESHLAVPHGLS